MSYIHSKLKRSSGNSSQNVSLVPNVKKKLYIKTLWLHADTATNNFSFKFSTTTKKKQKYFFLFISFCPSHRVVLLLPWRFSAFICPVLFNFESNSRRIALKFHIEMFIDRIVAIRVHWVLGVRGACMCPGYSLWKIWRSIVATGYNTIVETHQKAHTLTLYAIVKVCLRTRVCV